MNQLNYEEVNKIIDVGSKWREGWKILLKKRKIMQGNCNLSLIKMDLFQGPLSKEKTPITKQTDLKPEIMGW